MTSAEHCNAPLLNGSGHPKITPHHLQGLACIYVRQSTLKQVECNRESQFNQYQLAQRAKQLGWSVDKIQIIDCDQGQSGASTHQRSGFQELVMQVSLGRVGIIFGYEVSRLARNNTDWYQLLDLAALFTTLIADSDGIYDPRSYNDRLLLGLKGTMSEAELHLIRQRMEVGRLNQVKRGTYRLPLPTGLCRLGDGQVVKDPDEQVRQTLELVFNRFTSLGSCPKVARSLRQDQILLPVCQQRGLNKGQIRWREATISAVYALIRNPTYAGAFAYGRRQTVLSNPVVNAKKSQSHKALSDWLSLQQGVFPAYISWEQYLQNQKRLSQNQTTFKPNPQTSPGAARAGSALLQGLVVCGVCGYHLRVAYRGISRYYCNELNRQLKAPRCIWVSGPALEEVVVKAFFEVVQPAHLEALGAVLEEQVTQHQQLVQIWQQRLQRASYAVQLAERQYHSVDPQNRLVALELERRWESALQEQQQVQQAYVQFEASSPPGGIPLQLAEQFQQLCVQLPDLWQSNRFSHTDKKELLRCLVKQVIVRWLDAQRTHLEVTIVWVSGHYTIVEAYPPINVLESIRQPQVIEQIGRLYEAGLGEEEIANQLSKEGYRSARHPYLSAGTVVQLLHHYRQLHPERVKYRTCSPAGYLQVKEMAQRIGCEWRWLYWQLSHAKVAANYLRRHPRRPNMYLIEDKPEVAQQLSQLWQNSRTRKMRAGLVKMEN